MESMFHFVRKGGIERLFYEVAILISSTRLVA